MGLFILIKVLCVAFLSINRRIVGTLQGKINQLLFAYMSMCELFNKLKFQNVHSCHIQQSKSECYVTKYSFKIALVHMTQELGNSGDV